MGAVLFGLLRVLCVCFMIAFMLVIGLFLWGLIIVSSPTHGPKKQEEAI